MYKTNNIGPITCTDPCGIPLVVRMILSIQITGQFSGWIRSFLLGRKQRVIENGEKSEWSDVTSGILQGSVLGKSQ
jgi:hypothetical protein